VIYRQAIALLLLCVSFYSYAFEVNPLVSVLKIQEAESSFSVRVSNPTTEPLPIEVSSFELRFQDEIPGQGMPADDRLLIFPPAALIPPGGTQMVRVQWIGDLDVATDQSFLVLIEEVPVELPKNSGSAVQMLLSFNTVVHVIPNSTAPALEIVGTPSLVNDESLHGVDLLIRNSGNGLAVGDRILLELADAGDTTVIDAVDLQQLGIELFFPPNSSRTIRLPFPHSNNAESISAKVRYDSQ